MLKFASIFTLVTLLIAVAIYNDRMNHSALAVKTFDLNHDLLVQLEPFPVQVEEQTRFELRLADTSRLNKFVVREAWIEGLNMYMGKTSVYVDEPSDPKSVKGWFFLGSCSEPKMQWRLYMKVTTEKGEEILSFDFSTEV